MVHFSKLKLYGFKSFVDKAEVEIGEGLNGIVGPNGCGKSNLVEALRWVMGEKSAKSMRGGGMEDVIFAGTSKRPARNMAEATIIIDNSDGTAPAPFNNATEIEITRRIEKDKGSQYRVNGKAVRARDVNLLFADTMTGANSPALVSQGRITEIIIAKPQDRRRILEESAGISGLHTRRHEAELRLRAAEQNLTRLDDSLNDMRSRLTSLKRQSRQAERYKEFNTTIRRLDMALAWSTWRDIRETIKGGRNEFDIENTAVQKALEETKAIENALAALDKTLPDCRTDNMEARAILQNFRVSLERLEQDINAKAQNLRDAENAHQQLEQDFEFANAQLDQTHNQIDKAEKDLEHAKLNADTLPDLITKLDSECSHLKSTLDDFAAQKHALETQTAVAEQSRADLQARRDDYHTRLETLKQSHERVIEKIASLNDEKSAVQSDATFAENLDTLANTLGGLQKKIEDKTAKFDTMTAGNDDLRAQKNNLSSEIHALQAEATALDNLISRTESQNDIAPDQALLSHLDVDAGFEKAAATALGHWVSCAGIDATASVYWNASGTRTQTPAGYHPLAQSVKAPKALDAFLSSVGVCDTLPDTLPTLNSGQIIVSKDGGLMRWDGLVAKASTDHSSDTTSLILEQKNRVATLRTTIDTQTIQYDKIADQYAQSTSDLETLKDDLKSLHADLHQQQSTLTQKRHQQERLQDRVQSIDSTIASLTDDVQKIAQDITDTQKTYEGICAELTQHGDQFTTDNAAKITTLDNHINETRPDYESKTNAVSQAKFELTTTTQTITALTTTRDRLTVEKDTLSTRLDELSTRIESTLEKIKDYKASSGLEDTDDMRESLLDKISTQEAKVSEISTQLETMDNEYRTLQTSLRSAEAQAAGAREKRAVIQTNVANAEEELKRIESTITEKFETNPQSLEEQTLSLFGDTLPPVETLHTQREDALRGRDAIGPVNLRAALETQETETFLLDMEREYNDLTKAIEHLRGGIAKLNREARERLGIAFQRVDAHFQKLFADLFQGGKAYLQMIESTDPLESGLEIFAQPPGKSLQKLSLLSGGEQTLTATALIFAMFLTNPSPICVLDEIDAPLDDANVDRVCGLMEKIARETNTRFIVITHHRMTMARMDRLYGVTMSERGVSQLVSVDLAMQEELLLDNKETA